MSECMKRSSCSALSAVPGGLVIVMAYSGTRLKDIQGRARDGHSSRERDAFPV
jgi:hypothetical protein